MGIKAVRTTGLRVDAIIGASQRHGHRFKVPPRLVRSTDAYVNADLLGGLRLWAADLEVEAGKAVEARYACPIFCSFCLEGHWSCQPPLAINGQTFQSGDIGLYALRPEQVWMLKPCKHGRLSSVGIEVPQTWLAGLSEKNQVLGEQINRFQQTSPRVVFGKATHALRARAAAVFANQPPSATHSLQLESFALELLAQAFDMMPGDTAHKTANPQPSGQQSLSQADRLAMTRVRRTLDENFATKWTLQTLAHHACISPKQLQSRFAAAFGVSVFGYLQRLRLERAQYLLQGGCTVTQVTFEVGYAHVGSFSRAYRQHFGCPPSALL